MIHSDTIKFIESAEKTFKSRAEKYKIGKAVARDNKIKEKYKTIAKDLKYILKMYKDGQI